MLSTINFLFLLSLGFLSWTILCYTQQIQQFVNLSANVPQKLPKKEIPLMAEPAKLELTIPSAPNNNDYDFPQNFACIFVFIYALAKITHLAETYMARRIRHKVYVPTTVKPEKEELETINLQQQQENVIWKNNEYESQNQDVKVKPKSTVENIVPTRPNLDDKIRIVLIINKDKHVVHQPPVKQNDSRNMEFEKEKRKQSIWEKYMELQNPMSHIGNDQISTYMPVVMSSKELDNVKSIF